MRKTILFPKVSEGGGTLKVVVLHEKVPPDAQNVQIKPTQKREIPIGDWQS